MDNFTFDAMVKARAKANYAYNVAFLRADNNSLEDILDSPIVIFRRKVYTYLSLVRCRIGDVVVVTTYQDGAVALSLAIVVEEVGLPSAVKNPIVNAAKTSMIVGDVAFIGYLRAIRRACEKDAD